MTFLFAHYAWVPLVATIYVLSAYVSLRVNHEEGFRWFIASWLMGFIPARTLVGRYRRSLGLDGVVFDFSMTAAYLVGIYTFSHTWGTLRPVNGLGVGLVLAGLVCMRWGRA